MAELVLRVQVQAPPQVVWEAITDWEHQGEWMLGTTVRPTHRDGRGVGGRFEAWTGIGPVGFLDTMDITTWDPPWRCLVRHTGSVVRGAGAFEVQDLGTGRSDFVWSEWLELPLGRVGQVGWLLVRPFAAVGVQLSLRRFARWAERRAATAGPPAR